MFPKLHHGTDVNRAALTSLHEGWAGGWHARGMGVVGWGWLEGDPYREAELAVQICRTFDLDGYIANAEHPHEGTGKWKSEVFVTRFRELAPRAPLGLSYIGFGNPHRDLDFQPWLDAGATMMPQCYDHARAEPVGPSMWSAANAGIPATRIAPTLGTSGLDPYPAGMYRDELDDNGLDGFSVWLLESTPDDTLRTLGLG